MNSIWRYYLWLSLLSVLLCVSWSCSSLRPLWDLIDLHTFRFLNSWVHHSSWGSHFWAFANHRAMDWIQDIAMLLFFIISIYRMDKQDRSKGVSHLLALVVLLLLSLLVTRGILLKIEYLRDSPTYRYEVAFRLSDQISWMRVKDASHTSFPSDHAVTTLLFFFYALYVLGPKNLPYLLPHTLFFCLPRLVSGAHALTDIIIGSLPIALGLVHLFFITLLAKAIGYIVTQGSTWVAQITKRSDTSLHLTPGPNKRVSDHNTKKTQAESVQQ